MSSDSDNNLLANEFVRNSNMRTAVLATTILGEDWVDLSPVTLQLGIRGHAVKPLASRVGESSGDGITVNMEISDWNIGNARVVTTTRSGVFILVLEFTDSLRMLDGEVGMNAARKEQHRRRN